MNTHSWVLVRIQLDLWKIVYKREVCLQPLSDWSAVGFVQRERRGSSVCELFKWRLAEWVFAFLSPIFWQKIKPKKTDSSEQKYYWAPTVLKVGYQITKKTLYLTTKIYSLLGGGRQLQFSAMMGQWRALDLESDCPCCKHSSAISMWPWPGG